MKKILAIVALFALAIITAPTAAANDEVVSVCEQKYVGQCIVTAYTTSGGEVCFYVSQQMPTCTLPVLAILPALPDGAAVCTKFTGCVLTVFWTEDNVCFYPTTAPTFCVFD